MVQNITGLLYNSLEIPVQFLDFLQGDIIHEKDLSSDAKRLSSLKCFSMIKCIEKRNSIYCCCDGSLKKRRSQKEVFRFDSDEKMSFEETMYKIQSNQSLSRDFFLVLLVVRAGE
jgi:hypothetical protein